MNIYTYEMEYKGEFMDSDLRMIPFQKEYYEIYESMYNECFYEMRKALDVKPYVFYHDYEQMEEKSQDIYLYFEKGELVGSVYLDGNEIDDLMVAPAFQGNGYGTKILKFAIHALQLRQKNPIILHVLQWNKKARLLYEKYGFEYTLVIRIKHDGHQNEHSMKK